jgi:hypothetical protein
MPGTKTFVSGVTLTAADMNDYARGGLVMGYASTTTPQSGITTIADLTSLTVTITALSGRLYRTTVQLEVLGSVAGDLAVAYIANGANTLLQRAVVTIPALSGGTGYSHVCLQHYWTGSGSTTHKARLERNAGSGTVQSYAEAASPAIIIVEDIGVA